MWKIFWLSGGIAVTYETSGVGSLGSNTLGRSGYGRGAWATLKDSLLPDDASQKGPNGWGTR
jgi:hypothetical protein